MATSCLCDICNCGRHRCVQERTSIYQKVNASTAMPTEYATQYPAHQSYEPRASKKPATLHVMKGRLDTVPTSRDHFPEWGPCARQAVLPHDNYHLRTHKFGGSSSYQEQFEAKPAARRESLKPKTTYVMKGRLDTVPTSRDHFPPRDQAKREAILPVDNYHLVTHKFGGNSAYQEQFKAKPDARRESLKPETTYVMKGRLDTVPTSRDHFPAWGPCARETVLPHDNYHLVTHKFGGRSAYQEQFEAKPAARRESLKPKTTYVMKGRLDTVPTSRDHFSAWGPCARETVLPHDNYHLVTHKFGGKSAYQEQFEAKPAAARTSVPPYNHLHLSREIFGGTGRKVPLTTSGVEHGPKRINVCPASTGEPPGFVFTECDDRGHRCFRKLDE